MSDTSATTEKPGVVQEAADEKASTLKIWMDGELVDQENAKVSVFDHGLLYGNLATRKHFKVSKSPGLFSAVEAVRVKAAAAVLAPVSTKGLAQLLPTTLRVPPPAMVLLSNRVVS
jgi:hypothetical protein